MKKNIKNVHAASRPSRMNLQIAPLNGDRNMMSYLKSNAFRSRAAAYALALAACGCAVFVYGKYVYLLGFPDGFASESERAERTLAYVFIGLSAAFAAVCVHQGRAAGAKTGRRLAVASVLYLIGALCLLLIGSRLPATLTNAAGG